MPRDASRAWVSLFTVSELCDVRHVTTRRCHPGLPEVTLERFPLCFPSPTSASESFHPVVPTPHGLPRTDWHPGQQRRAPLRTQAATLCDLLQRIAPAVDDVRDTVFCICSVWNFTERARPERGFQRILRRVLGDLSALRLFPSELLAEVFFLPLHRQDPITDARHGLGPVLRGACASASVFVGPGSPTCAHFATRLASLDLTASYDALSDDPPSFPSLVALHAACPSGLQEHSVVLQRSLAAFLQGTAPATLTVHLPCGLFSLAALASAWPNLSTVHLTSVYHVDVLYEVLLCVPLLSDFAFESRSIIGYSFTAPSLPSLPRLKSISARLPPEDARQLFDALDCPNLEELSFSWARIHHQAVLDFASRCRWPNLHAYHRRRLPGLCAFECVEESSFPGTTSPSEWSVAFPAVRNLVLLITRIPSLAFYADAVVISPFLDDLSLDGARAPPLVHLSRELRVALLSSNNTAYRTNYFDEVSIMGCRPGPKGLVLFCLKYPGCDL
ncbi:hypothetical protein C8R43DRAFT_1143666 [Mycena crocata]|nr:hypothetical protein C8R43DRAFT_1143666 [Mycena crocata]